LEPINLPLPQAVAGLPAVSGVLDWILGFYFNRPPLSTEKLQTVFLKENHPAGGVPGLLDKENLVPADEPHDRRSMSLAA
jgi:hypothetical protein